MEKVNPDYCYNPEECEASDLVSEEYCLGVNCLYHKNNKQYDTMNVTGDYVLRYVDE